MSYQSVNPHDGKVFKTFEQLTDQQLESPLPPGRHEYKFVVDGR